MMSAEDIRTVSLRPALDIDAEFAYTVAEATMREYATETFGWWDADRTRSAELLDNLDAACEKVALGVVIERRVPFVDPAVQRNLMSRSGARPDLSGMEQRGDGWNEK